MHPLDAPQLAIKVFAEPATQFTIEDVIPVFHSWIQTKALPDLMIDVADYGHVQDGPGVLLICHEANYALDMTDGRLGLKYLRKRASPGTTRKGLLAGIHAGLFASCLLEQAPLLGKRLRFATTELEIGVHNRLMAANSPATFDAARAELESTLRDLFDDPAVRLEPEPRAREAFRVLVRPSKQVALEQLRSRAEALLRSL